MSFQPTKRRFDNLYADLEVVERPLAVIAYSCEMNLALTLAIAALFVLNGAASLAVWKSRLYSPAQCRSQFAIIWVVPLVGALIVLVALKSARENARRHRVLRHDPDNAVQNFSQRSAADDD